MALIELKKEPSKKELAWFGLLLLLFFGLLGLMARFRFDSPAGANRFWITGGALCVVYYALPFLRRWMFRGWMLLTFPIGWVVSHVVLLVTFYLVLTPIGLILRLGGRDPMKRRLDPDAASYWEAHRPGGNTARYFRQS